MRHYYSRITIYAVTILLLFTACNRNGGAYQPPEEEILGNWKLTEAWRRNSNSAQYVPVNTGYERGFFIFRDNGTAEYVDTTFTMNGGWTLRESNRQALNTDSTWRTWTVLELHINLFNYPANRYLQWSFDSIRFRGRLECYNNAGLPKYRYFFSKQ